jgi:dienelactone hydrolase
MTDFASEPLQLAGVTGEIVTVASANPLNYYQAISASAEVPGQDIHGQLFLPEQNSKSGSLPVVIIVPGSLGVAPSHIAHAETLIGEGIGVFVIDPFGARLVTSTVANQAQFSFAASAWDVLAAAKTLASRSNVDENRIGAQGHSRGGSAVISAAMEPMANAVGISLCAVYGAYPWCGHQFRVPRVGKTVVRAVIGDQDEWCLPQQVQAAMHAIQLSGGESSIQIFEGAHHSFDRGTELELVADASVAPAAPTTYVREDGLYIHPVTGPQAAETTDREVMIYGIKAGYGVRGARIGSSGEQAALFRKDMLAYWTKQLLT